MIFIKKSEFFFKLRDYVSLVLDVLRLEDLSEVFSLTLLFGFIKYLFYDIYYQLINVNKRFSNT